MTILERIIGWDPEVRLAYALEGLPKAVRSAVNEWVLAADGPYSTTVTLSSSVDLGPRPPQQIAAKAVGRKMGQANQQMVDGLRAYCLTLQEA